MHIAAALMLLLCQEPEVDVLIRDLDHDDLERREKASTALRKLEVDNLEIDRKLEKLAKSGTGEVAKRCEQIRRFRAATRLLPDAARVFERLASPNVQVRQATVSALSRRGGVAAPIVRGLLGDPDPGVQQVTLQILMAADDPEYQSDIRTLAEHPQLQGTALQWLANRGDASIAPILRGFVDRNPTWAIDMLARLRLPEDIPLVRAQIQDQPYPSNLLRMIRNWPEARRQLSREIRTYAREGMVEAILMAEARDPEFMADLKALSLKENPAAIYVMGTLGDPDSLPFLMRLVRQRRLPAAIEVLGRLRAREAVWLFRRMIGETPPPEPRDRAAYARALGRIGGTDAEDLLLFMAEDASEEVRFDVAGALGMLKSMRALPHLIRSLDDAVAFQKPGPLPSEPTLFDLYEGRTGPAEWRQVREAALASIEIIQGEKKPGTLDERAAAWRSWWAARPSGR